MANPANESVRKKKKPNKGDPEFERIKDLLFRLRQRKGRDLTPDEWYEKAIALP